MKILLLHIRFLMILINVLIFSNFSFCWSWQRRCYCQRRKSLCLCQGFKESLDYIIHFFVFLLHNHLSIWQTVIKMLCRLWGYNCDCRTEFKWLIFSNDNFNYSFKHLKIILSKLSSIKRYFLLMILKKLI